MEKVIENHNKSIQMKWINSIRELAKHKDLSCAGEDDFNLPIVKISPSQKSKLKKLIHERATTEA